MLDLKKYKADIEEADVTRKGMTVEFWAEDYEQAKKKLYWLIGLNYDRNWINLQEIKEEI